MGVDIQMLAAAAQTAAQKAAKAEKARQKALNLLYTDIYAYIIGGILGALVLRNLFLTCVRYLDSRGQHHGDVLEKQPGRLRGDERYAQRTAILRWSQRLDQVATRPVRGFPIEWTYVRFFFVTVIVVINTVFCIVRLAIMLPEGILAKLAIDEVISAGRLHASALGTIRGVVRRASFLASMRTDGSRQLSDLVLLRWTQQCDCSFDR